MIEKFAGMCGTVRSEFLDLNHPFDSEVRSGRWLRGVANFGIWTLAR
jgi:hypothetical protein